MAGSRTASRIVTAVVGALVAISVGGLITLTVLTAFVWDRFDAYGEIPIPGSAAVELPEGTVTVNFHVHSSRESTAVPPLHMNIEPPSGGSDPLVTDELGGSVVVNNDIHRQVWVMQVPAAGVYQVGIDGPVAGFDQPRLAFGKTGSMDGLIWVFVAMSMISVDLAIAVWWMRRHRAKAVAPVVELADPYLPTDQGVRLEQLKTIAALRDSGALTEDEFRDEKRRILEGR